MGRVDLLTDETLSAQMQEPFQSQQFWIYGDVAIGENLTIVLFCSKTEFYIDFTDKHFHCFFNLISVCLKYLTQ